jgi:AcrR family transcriptional regulator
MLLLNAARERFERDGWADTRMDDIADAAGVSIATAYNHFSSKHALLAHVYAPLLTAEQDRSRGRDDPAMSTSRALELHVRDLASLAVGRHRVLSGALTQALREYSARVPRPPTTVDGAFEDVEDPRLIAPMAAEVTRLIANGQQRGEFHRFPPAARVGQLIAQQLLTAAADYPNDAPAVTANTILALVFGALHPQLLIVHQKSAPSSDPDYPGSFTAG